jgi:hypothetical protein
MYLQVDVKSLVDYNGYIRVESLKLAILEPEEVGWMITCHLNYHALMNIQ